MRGGVQSEGAVPENLRGLSSALFTRRLPTPTYLEEGSHPGGGGLPAVGWSS